MLRGFKVGACNSRQFDYEGDETRNAWKYNNFRHFDIEDFLINRKLNEELNHV